jgi:hypothetical protein
MRIEPKISHGDIQFLVSAENGADRVVLEKFIQECRAWDRKLNLHGAVHSRDLGCYTSFNFGTLKKS